MQILKSVYENLEITGLSNYHSIRKYPFSTRNLTSVFIHALNIICNFGFIVSGQTGNLMEFTDSLYITLTVIFGTSIFIKLIWKMHQLFGFFNRLEDIVAQSK